MAVKYTREHYGRGGFDADALRRGPGRAFRMTAKQRLGLIYLGVGAFVIVMLFVQTALPRLQFQGQPLISGRGVVFEKTVSSSPGGQRRHRVGVAVQPADGQVRIGYLVLEQARWVELDDGCPVTLTYQTARWGRNIRVETLEPLASIEPFD